MCQAACCSLKSSTNNNKYSKLNKNIVFRYTPELFIEYTYSKRANLETKRLPPLNSARITFITNVPSLLKKIRDSTTVIKEIHYG